jgi:hypothetical protein
MDYSSDGRYLVYRKNSPDLWVLDNTTGEHFNVVAGSSGRIRWPQMSPDGRWLAYQLDSADGSSTIHIHGPFEPPNTGQRSASLSIAGGGWVRWSADGRELYYAAPDGTLMTVALRFDSGGNGFTAAAPEALFTVPMAMGPLNRSIAQQYMVDESGERFLVLAATPAESPVHLLGY